MTKYKGQIADFPTEVVEKMLEKQVEQGNPKDVTVFEKYKEPSKYNKGFDWDNTKEGNNFWHSVIRYRMFDVFFERYPKTTDKTFQDKFPTYINLEQARKLLAEMANKEGWLLNWADDLVLNDCVLIPYPHYLELKEIVDKKVLEEIFGVEVDFSILNEEDVFYIEAISNYSKLAFSFVVKGKKFFEENVNFVELENSIERSDYGKTCDKENIVLLRKANKKEEEIHYKHFPQWSLEQAKDQEPVWIADIEGGLWFFKYADGKGNEHQKKQGEVYKPKYARPFDPNNLPYTE